MLALIEGHLTNSQIADELCLSVRTVESHVTSLMRKLGVADRRSLARQAGRTTPARARGRWPVAVSSYVGREPERQALLALIAGHRMVTITGPGGVGKTRLAVRVAQEVAETRRDGGWFVDLVQVTDPGMMVAALAAAVGVAEPPGGSLADAVAAALSTSDGVVVLDNCEHLLDAVRSCVAHVLASCPELQVLTTSRVRLGAPFEWVYEVPGLSVTADGGGDAVRLFVERASAAGATSGVDPRQVGVLCRSLEGMALAIELAAGRCPSLGVDGLVAGLDRRLRYLTTGAAGDDRHRSLRDAIGWSWDLLDPPDRELLGAVSVFASWFDVHAAAALTGPASLHADVQDLADVAEVADALARLADHHLLVALPGEPTRYRVLETIRQYADERLGRTGQLDAVHDRHRLWCAGQLTALAGQPHDDAWCVRFDRLADDVRAAIVRAADRYLDAPACALAEQLAEQLLLRGQPAEAQRRYEQAARHAVPGRDRIRLLWLAAGVAAARVTGNDTLRLLDTAAAEARDLGDHAMAADCRAWMVIYLTMMPGIIADLPRPEDGARWLAEARALSEGSPRVEGAIDVATAAGLPESDPASSELARRAVDLARAGAAPLVESVALDQLCGVSLARGDLAGAIGFLRHRGTVLDALPLDASTAYQFNDYLLMASEVHLAAGDLERAAHYADRLAGLACYREMEHLATSRRIKVDAMAGHLDRAAAQGERFLAAWERSGRPFARTLNVTCGALALVHGLRGDDHRREQWLAMTRLLSVDPARLEDCRTGWAPTFDALVALDRDQADVALTRLSADIEDKGVWATGLPHLWRPWYAAAWVEAAVLAGAPDAADRFRRGAAAARVNPVATAIVHRAGDLLKGDRLALHRYADVFAGLGCRYQQRRSVILLERVTG